MKRKHIIVGIVLIGGIILFSNYQSIFKSIVPPEPEIVNSSADGSSSSLLDYSIKVTGTLINRGGDGYIVIKAYVEQEGDKYEKSKQVYLPSYQTEEFEFIFDEVKLLKKEPTYYVRAFALGNLRE